MYKIALIENKTAYSTDTSYTVATDDLMFNSAIRGANFTAIFTAPFVGPLTTRAIELGGGITNVIDYTK